MALEADGMQKKILTAHGLVIWSMFYMRSCVPFGLGTWIFDEKMYQSPKICIF